MNKSKKVKPYLIDNEQADSRDIIRKAKECGYEGYRGIFRTSVAAGILREHNYKVERNPTDTLKD